MVCLRAKKAIHALMNYLKSTGIRRSRSSLLAVMRSMLVMLVFYGCSEGLRLVQSSESGGIVVYPFKESGSLLSPFRKDALEMMQQHCGGSYRIVREGETKARSRINENPGGMEEIRERRWGIEFECKEKK
jgi:hypothetical protein